MSIDTPSDAAIEEALRLTLGGPAERWKPCDIRTHAPHHVWAFSILAHATTLQEMDRVARELECNFADVGTPDELRSLMLPDPPDPDEELAREVADWLRKQPGLISWQSDVPSLIIKRLREQGRLTDAK